MTKPNVYELIASLRQAADQLEAYHNYEPMKCSAEMANVLNHAQVLIETEDAIDREIIFMPRLRDAIWKYKQSLEGKAK